MKRKKGKSWYEVLLVAVATLAECLGDSLSKWGKMVGLWWH